MVKDKAQTKLDLEKMVSYPSWREMLMDLVVEEEFDPWDIDISAITSKYIQQIKEMKTLELQIPANLILAASILLKLKSKDLVFEEEVQIEVDETFVDEEEGPIEIPMLELRTRIPPKRRVSLEELVEAVEEVFKEEQNRIEKQSKIEIPKKMILQLPEITIDEQINEVKQRMLNLKDEKGMVLFSNLIKNKTPNEKVFALLPLLYLQQKHEVFLIQEKLFGEIIIHVNFNKLKELDDKHGKIA
ncbi:segregation/condensation protein A [Candidatus Micrarchaeota archaeon]|nr:segregation/condensation protein A [Candidatus Micrarchaeota archaeon]